MLTEVMDEELIVSELKATSKEEAIKKMVSTLAKKRMIEDEKKFIYAINEREKLESTAIGEGIAIPHARSESVRGLGVAFARSKQGIDFDALDKKSVHLIFMIACGMKTQKQHLQILARIARLCKNKKMKEALIEARDSEEIMGLIKSFDAGSGKLEKIKMKKGKTVYPNNE